MSKLRQDSLSSSHDSTSDSSQSLSSGSQPSSLKASTSHVNLLTSSKPSQNTTSDRPQTAHSASEQGNHSLAFAFIRQLVIDTTKDDLDNPNVPILKIIRNLGDLIPNEVAIKHAQITDPDDPLTHEMVAIKNKVEQLIKTAIKEKNAIIESVSNYIENRNKLETLLLTDDAKKIFAAMNDTADKAIWEKTNNDLDKLYESLNVTYLELWNKQLYASFPKMHEPDKKYLEEANRIRIAMAKIKNLYKTFTEDDLDSREMDEEMLDELVSQMNECLDYKFLSSAELLSDDKRKKLVKEKKVRDEIYFRDNDLKGLKIVLIKMITVSETIFPAFFEYPNGENLIDAFILYVITHQGWGNAVPENDRDIFIAAILNDLPFHIKEAIEAPCEDIYVDRESLDDFDLLTSYDQERFPDGTPRKNLLSPGHWKREVAGDVLTTPTKSAQKREQDEAVGYSPEGVAPDSASPAIRRVKRKLPNDSTRRNLSSVFDDLDDSTTTTPPPLKRASTATSDIPSSLCMPAKSDTLVTCKENAPASPKKSVDKKLESPVSSPLKSVTNTFGDRTSGDLAGRS